MKFYVLTVVLTAVATLALTWVVWRIGMRYRLYPEIRERDVHTTPKPRVGGVDVEVDLHQAGHQVAARGDLLQPILAAPQHH